MSELQTLALNILRDLRLDFERQMKTLSQNQASQGDTLKALEARQVESEQLLRNLSELYNRLSPLIEAINSDVRNGPR